MMWGKKYLEYIEKDDVQKWYRKDEIYLCERKEKIFLERYYIEKVEILDWPVKDLLFWAEVYNDVMNWS